MEEEKKIERKRKRFAARLNMYKGIVCTETVGPNIVLCNAGQATGFEKENVHNLINKYSLDLLPPKFISVKGEYFSFLIFRSTENAVSFFNACHGKAKADKNGTPIYVNFIEDVPITEVICTHKDPKGLTLLNNFITKEEEIQFIELFDWAEDQIQNLKHRQVKHYGYEFRYGSNDVDLENPLQRIPLECDILWKRLEEQGFSLGRPDQLTVNKYSPGHGIPFHVDRHSPFGKTILSLSLGSSVVMDWKHHSGKSVPVVLPPRSMLVMQDEARYDWQHGIHHSTTDPVIECRTDGEGQNNTKVITGETRQRGTRISLTFRWTRRGPCECGFKSLCDTGGNTHTELDDSVAAHLEDLHVHQVYEQIAGHFSSTRHTPWPRVVQFARDVTPGAVLLDLGAGNGKNILRTNDVLQIAGERSSGLLFECAMHTRSVAAADCVRLDVLHAALRDRCADYIICIAVIHHMSTKARRLQAISTIHRLLRPTGRALITVWAKDQSRSNYLSKHKVATDNEQVNVNGVNLHIHENRTQFQHKDLLVPWKLRTKTDKLSKSDNKSSKSDDKSSREDKLSKSDDKLSKSDNKSSKSDDKSSREGKLSKSDAKLSKSDNKSSKSDDKLSRDDKSFKSYDKLSRDDKLSKSDDKLSKSDDKSPKSDGKSSKSESTLLRFYHVFEEGELDELCKEVGLEIESNFYEEGNWCVICKKIQ